MSPRYDTILGPKLALGPWFLVLGSWFLVCKAGSIERVWLLFWFVLKLASFVAFSVLGSCRSNVNVERFVYGGFLLTHTVWENSEENACQRG